MTTPGPAARPRSYVLDTSAVLAVLNREPGRDVVLRVLRQSVISTVNWAEVINLAMTGRFRSRRSRHDILQALQEARDVLNRRGLVTTNFTEPEAEISGLISPVTQPFNISLGDRACLSLGIALNLPVLTTEAGWLKFDVKADVRVITQNPGV